MYEFIHTTDHTQHTWHRRLPTSSYPHVHLYGDRHASCNIQNTSTPHEHTHHAHPGAQTQTGPDRTGPDRTRAAENRTGPDCNRPAQIGPDRTGPRRWPGRTGPDQNPPKSDRTVRSGPVPSLIFPTPSLRALLANPICSSRCARCNETFSSGTKDM